MQKVYRSQGVPIHDKHIEVIVRQMLRRVTSSTTVTPTCCRASSSTAARYERANRASCSPGQGACVGPSGPHGYHQGVARDRVVAVGRLVPGDHAGAHPGAIDARSDALLGLKENVIIGKLIPAGTGMNRYRNIPVEPTEEARAAVYTMASYGETDWTTAQFGAGPGQAVPLDDLDYRGDYR